MVTALIAMAIAGYLSRQYSHRAVMLVAIPAILFGLVNALLVASPAAYLVSNLALAAVLSFLDLNMNAEGSDIEQEMKQPIFTSFHALLSVTLAGAAIVSSYVTVNYAVWWPAVLAAALLAWAFVAVYRNVPQRMPDAGDTVSPVSLPRGKLTLIGTTIGLSNSCEIAAMLWAGQLLAELAPQLAAYSGLGVAFFGLCSGTMRIAADHLRKLFNDLTIVIVSLAVATSGFAILGARPGFALSVAAFAAVGFGLGFVFPFLFALAGRQAPLRRAAAMSFAGAISGGPRFVFPWILGLLSTWYGISAVFIVCALLAFATLLMIAFVLAPMARPATNSART
jgi:MFS family permease